MFEIVAAILVAAVVIFRVLFTAGRSSDMREAVHSAPSHIPVPEEGPRWRNRQENLVIGWAFEQSYPNVDIDALMIAAAEGVVTALRHISIGRADFEAIDKNPFARQVRRAIEENAGAHCRERYRGCSIISVKPIHFEKYSAGGAFLEVDVKILHRSWVETSRGDLIVGNASMPVVGYYRVTCKAGDKPPVSDLFIDGEKDVCAACGAHMQRTGGENCTYCGAPAAAETAHWFFEKYDCRKTVIL